MYIWDLAAIPIPRSIGGKVQRRDLILQVAIELSRNGEEEEAVNIQSKVSHIQPKKRWKCHTIDCRNKTDNIYVKPAKNPYAELATNLCAISVWIIDGRRIKI